MNRKKRKQEKEMNLIRTTEGQEEIATPLKKRKLEMCIV